MLLVFETHPVQYHAPVYQRLVAGYSVPVHVVYGSNFSCKGYRDAEFRTTFSWDCDLLEGYPSTILTDAPDLQALRTVPLSRVSAGKLPQKSAIRAALGLGYSSPFDRHFLRRAIFARTPLLFRAETTDIALQRNAVKQLIRDVFLKTLYSRCARVLPIGLNSRNHYRRLGVPESKLVDSPYCVDERVFQTDDSTQAEHRCAVRQRLGIAPNAVVLAYSGKLATRKGVDLIGAAIRRLPGILKGRIHLLIIGDGELRESLGGDWSSGVDPIPASFVGFQNQRQLSQYYNAADLFTLPSRRGETWGLVVNEALLHGLPCIVSNRVGSHPDLVVSGETGEVFRSEDTSSFAECILRVEGWRSSTTRSRCQSRAASYSVDRAASGIARAYREVVAS